MKGRAQCGSRRRLSRHAYFSKMGKGQIRRMKEGGKGAPGFRRLPGLWGTQASKITRLRPPTKRPDESRNADSSAKKAWKSEMTLQKRTCDGRLTEGSGLLEKRKIKEKLSARFMVSKCGKGKALRYGHVGDQRGLCWVPSGCG